MSNWALSNLAVLDDWRAAQSDLSLRRQVTEAIRGLRVRPDEQGEPGSRVNPSVRVLVVEGVVVRYLVAEQFRTVRLLAITA